MRAIVDGFALRHGKMSGGQLVSGDGIYRYLHGNENGADGDVGTS